jgi:hypothetical protein
MYRQCVRRSRLAMGYIALEVEVRACRVRVVGWFCGRAIIDEEGMNCSMIRLITSSGIGGGTMIGNE